MRQREKIARALGLTVGQVSRAERDGLAKLRKGFRRAALECARPAPCPEWNPPGAGRTKQRRAFDGDT